MRLLLLLLLPFVLLTACAPLREGVGGDSTAPGDRPQIEFGWSFGNCGGECRAEVIVATNGDVSLESRTWDDQVGRSVTGTAQPETLDALSVAYDGLDRAALLEVYGCPDCADGGAEFVRFRDGIDPLESTWEWGNPPSELAPLRAVLRPLADALWACDDGAGYDQLDCTIFDNAVDPVPPG